MVIIKKLKKFFIGFWNNNHTSQEDWDHWCKYIKENPGSEAMPPIGTRDFILAWVISISIAVTIVCLLP